MGKSYWYECARCGYRARVSGRADRGVDFYVQTILCRDCNEIYDAVVRIRLPEGRAAANASLRRTGLSLHQQSLNQAGPRVAPTFQAALGRLPLPDLTRFRWVRFAPQCPVTPSHRIRAWNEPDVCPKCRLPLERNVLPYRIWE